LQIKLDKSEKSAKDAESDTTLKDEICALRLKLSEMNSDTETRFREFHDKCREVLNKSNEHWRAQVELVKSTVAYPPDIDDFRTQVVELVRKLAIGRIAITRC
jgi:hypothetical protein